MKILFVHAENENLGVQYLSAVLKKAGHQVKLILDPCLFKDSFFSNSFLHRKFSYRRILLKQAKKYRPDIIAFSVLSDRYAWASEMAGILKRNLHVPIIFGGLHPTLVPEVVISNKNVDMVCVGEGEEAMVELTNSYSGGRFNMDIRNIWFKNNGQIIKNPIRPLIRELDNLPYPDRDLYDFEISPGRYLIMASRGCINHCSYCYNCYYKRLYGSKNYLRLRSVDSVIDELILAKRKYKPRYIIFHDDVFGFNLRWLKEFRLKYKKHVNLPFYCSLCPSYVTKEHLKILDDCKCILVNMGIQTTNEDYAKNMLNRINSNKKLIQVLNWFKDTNIWLMTDILLGLPGQTRKDLIKEAKFFSKHHSDQIACYWLIYYPKLEILRKAREKGFLNDADIDKITRDRKSTRLNSSHYS